ncbi:MAG: hypothetical protein ACO1O6_07560 [Bacteroidota bacterium]
MKTLFLFVATVLAFTGVNAQSKYETGMTKAMAQFEAAKTPAELLNASAQFERIADAEKDEWLPYYYAALTNNMASWADEKADKDKMAEKSIILVEKAEIIEGSNASELYCMRNMIASSQMMVNPMERWQTYGAEANKALENAKKADKNNPRIYFLEGQAVFNTPEAFGGGKKNAKPLFEKSVALYETFVPASPLHPKWGKEEAAGMLKQCNE